MGWLFSDGQTKESLRKEITAERSREIGYFKTLRSQFRGNTLWCLHELYDGVRIVRFVGCYLFARHDGMWGYKEMDETCGPCYYDCPISYINNSTAPANSYSEEWREKVRAHAMAKAAQDAKRPKIGETWSLIGCNIPSAVICSERPLHGMANGIMWKIRRRHLGSKIGDMKNVDNNSKPVEDDYERREHGDIS